MHEDSVRVTFDWVLDQVRLVLNVASPTELHTLFQELLDAQVFPSYHCLSPRDEAHTQWERGTSDTDREDLARRMALPMWQRWDLCQGILQSVLYQSVDSGLEFTCTSELALMLSDHTVHHSLLPMGQHCHRPVRVPMLAPVHCRKCLQWTCEQQNWTMKQWKKVVRRSPGETHGTRMYNRKRTSWQRQSDALDNVVLGSLPFR